MMNHPRLRPLAALFVIAVGLVAPASVPTQAAPAAQWDDNLTVELAQPQPRARLRGPVWIEGYALDRRGADGSGLNERDVQVYLGDWSDPRHLLDYAPAELIHADAARTLGVPPAWQSRAAHFTTAWESCAFPPGRYTLTIIVSSLATPGARNMTQREVEIEPCAAGAVLDEVDYSWMPGGALTVAVERQEERTFYAARVFADFAMGLDARCTPGGAGCRYALYFREQPGPRSARTNGDYRFSVDPTAGTFGLEFRPPGGDPLRGTELLPPTPSPAIRRGTAINRLAVVARGPTLELFVNGEQVGQVQDERGRWGRLGWVTLPSAAGQPAEAQFRDLVIAVPGPRESLRSVLRGTLD
jgi:hypothetical protein